MNMRQKIMAKKILKLTLLLSFIGLLTACAGTPFYHKNFMKGQIIGIDNDEVVVCIGGKNGAKEGENFQVYRYIWEGAIAEGEDHYKVDYIGVVQINSIVNEHFARAKVLQGAVRAHDMLELRE